MVLQWFQLKLGPTLCTKNLASSNLYCVFTQVQKMRDYFVSIDIAPIIEMDITTIKELTVVSLPCFYNHHMMIILENISYKKFPLAGVHSAQCSLSLGMRNNLNTIKFTTLKCLAWHVLTMESLQPPSHSKYRAYPLSENVPLAHFKSI